MNDTGRGAVSRRLSAWTHGSWFARRGQRLPALLACACAAVLLAGCGSGSGGSSGGGPASVKIGKAVDTIGFTTVDIAKSKGYFAKEGVDVNEELLSGSSTAFAALQSGSVNFVTASSTALLNAKAKGVPLEAVASLDYGVSLQLLVSDSYISAHGLSPNEPLNTVMKKMVGAKLGEISTTDLAYDHYMEKQAGVDPGKFTYIQIDSQSAALAALKHGQIDAFLLSPPSTFFAQAQGAGKIIASLHQVPELANMAYDILLVDSDWAKSHASEVKAVATAMAMADNAAKANPQSVLDVEQQHYPKMDTPALLNSLKYVTFTQNGLFTQDMWQKAKSESAGSGSNKASGVDVSSGGGVWTNQYIDQSKLSGGSGSAGASPGSSASP